MQLRVIVVVLLEHQNHTRFQRVMLHPPAFLETLMNNPG
jgi:hypothetical protein